MNGDSTLISALIWLFLILVFCLIVYMIGGYPGYIARRRGHVNAEAISLCGWIGLVIWPAWFVALIWSRTGPDHSKDAPRSEPLPKPIYDCGAAEKVEGPRAGSIMPGQSRRDRGTH